MSETFVNKVAESGLISLDLASFLPANELVVFDIKPYLFMELILKEKSFVNHFLKLIGPNIKIK